MNPTPIVAERLTAQQLSGAAARTPEGVVQRLLAVQAQDARGARLAIRSRSVGLRAADVDAALTDRRSLVVTWLNRGTLHLIDAADYRWLHALTTPRIATANRRRLQQEGVSPAQAARGVDVVTAAVTEHGPQTRVELRRRLDAARVPTQGQALVHVLVAASLAGRIVRGPMRGAEHAFVAVSDWLGAASAPLDRDDALGLLATRYLAGHGPAAPADLAKWAGVTLGDARRAFAAAATTDATVVRPDGLVDLAARDPAAPVPAPKLLGPFDPLLLGWAAREPVVGVHRVVTTNGIFRACVLVGGRVRGIWRLAAGTLTITPLEPLPRSARAVLRRDALDVLRFLDLPADAEVIVES